MVWGTQSQTTVSIFWHQTQGTWSIQCEGQCLGNVCLRRIIKTYVGYIEFEMPLRHPSKDTELPLDILI